MGLCLEDEDNLVKTFFTWRSPPITIATLICLNFCALLVAHFQYPFITLLCYIVMTQIVVCISYTYLTKLYLTFHGNSNVSIPEITQNEYKDYFDHDSVQKTTQNVLAILFALLNFMINIYRCVNITKSMTIVILLFLTAQLARFVNFFLLLTWFLTAFTIFSYLSKQSAALAWWYETILNFFEVYDERYRKSSNPTLPSSQTTQSLHNPHFTQYMAKGDPQANFMPTTPVQPTTQPINPSRMDPSSKQQAIFQRPPNR
jgi:ABC-type multidrug transport system fused ATPase/permease subunit